MDSESIKTIAELLVVVVPPILGVLYGKRSKSTQIATVLSEQIHELGWNLQDSQSNTRIALRQVLDKRAPETLRDVIQE